MSFKGKIRTIEILLVDDNPGDIRLTQEALKDSKVLNNLHVVEDGLEALKYLRKKGEFKNEVTPDLILLDLNLPKRNGREVLSEIKEDELLKHIPVVILTISRAEEDILKSYELHANCYITKPVDMNQFVKIVRSIENFWFSIVKLPPNTDFL
jgi:CheY-like chemotaxis protein